MANIITDSVKEASTDAVRLLRELYTDQLKAGREAMGPAGAAAHDRSMVHLQNGEISAYVAESWNAGIETNSFMLKKAVAYTKPLLAASGEALALPVKAGAEAIHGLSTSAQTAQRASPCK